MIQEAESMVEFSLPAHDGSVVRSLDLAGRAYLLYFYPKANTPG
jgi:peroxiredoxin